MEAQAPKAMVEHFDINLMTNLWMTLNNNGLLTQWLSEYVKLVENSHCFNAWICARWSHFLPYAFTKDKLCNWFGQFLDTTIRMCAQYFFTGKKFPHWPLQVGKITKCKLVLPLKTFYSLEFCSLVFSLFGQAWWLYLLHHEFY
jgi:hypothetical protein